MKRVWIAVVILLLIPTIVFVTHRYLHSATGTMSEIIGTAQSKAEEGNKKEAAKQIAAFEKSWDNNQRIMGCFIRHSELDTVNQSTAKLMPLLQDDNLTSFSAECETLKMQLHHIVETENFSFDNLF